jgi:hypothetical protein
MRQPNTPQKSVSVTLRANGAKMILLAEQKLDGSFVTTVRTIDAAGQSSRGMTTHHPNLAASKAAIAALASAAEKAGWQRGKFMMTPRADAFTKLPAPPPKA